MYNKSGERRGCFEYNGANTSRGFATFEITPINGRWFYNRLPCRFTIEENKVLFGDGSNILYVNEKYRGNDEIGKLMHDFSCTNPDDMNYEALAKKARYFKQDAKGVATMCKIMEDMRNEKQKKLE